MKILKKIDKLIAQFFVALIRGYQYILSPDKWIPSIRLKWRICSHEPHCSQYSINALRRYGFVSWLPKAFDRVLHCTWWMKKIYDPEHYRVVFFSSAPIGVPFLQKLESDPRFDLVWVVTQCDKPAGRGLNMCECIIKQEARKFMPHPPTEKEKINTSSSSSFSFREGEMQKIIHEIAKKHHIYGESWWYQVWFAKDMRKNPTKAEEIIRNILRDRKFLNQKRRRQYPINSYIADFFCHEHKLIIELDGSIHNEEFQKNIDKEKEETIKNLWYEILRYKNEDIYDKLEFVLHDIAKHTSPSLKERDTGWGDFISTPNKLNPEKSQEWKEFANRLRNKQPDFLVVIAYGKIIPQAILDIPRFAPINVHGSILPAYRWASPIQSVLLDWLKETWITIMKMDAGLDTWNIIDTKKFKIDFHRTSQDLIQKMQWFWPWFLNDTLWKYGKWLLGEVVQDKGKATLCSKIEKESWLIDPFQDTLISIYNKYRAFYSWPKIYFFFKKEWWIRNDEWWIRIIIEELKINEKLFQTNKDLPLFLSSLIKEVAWTKWMTEDLLNPAVQNISLKPEWKKAISWKEFIQGYIR